MPVIETDSLLPGVHYPEGRQIYNALDSCITLEVFEAISRLSNSTPEIYNFELALQAPALDMMLRGFKIDEYERQKNAKDLGRRIADLELWLNELSHAVWDRPLNPRSPKQLREFFYGAMKLPEVYNYFRGEKKLSMNREALEKIDLYYYARPIVATILEIRELTKKLEVIETEIDPDGRMRSGYNIAGTETGRFSESASSLGTGRNRQNIDPSQRQMFVADSGWKILGIDLEQAESREVGLLHGTLFNDWTYLNSCEAGDLHTGTCKLVWKNLPWTGNAKKDREIADQKFYREFSYRDLGKRGGHATSYYGTAFTVARALKVPQKLITDFQQGFFAAYPAFQREFTWIAGQLQTKGFLTTPFGRVRHFFGRPEDDATLREGIAYIPQSATADRLNLALWRMWKHMKDVQLLLQIHDAIYLQYRDMSPEYEADVIRRALALISTPIKVKDRIFDVPGEAKIGWNWGQYDAIKNPDGLMKVRGQDIRTRTTILNRPL